MIKQIYGAGLPGWNFRYTQATKNVNRLLLVVDQSEELFTLSEERYRQPFIESLIAAASRADSSVIRVPSVASAAVSVVSVMLVVRQCPPGLESRCLEFAR